MFYVIQENTFREDNYDNLLKSIERLGLPYEIVKSRPFTEDVEFKTERKDVFVFGSVKLARTGRKYGWKPGSLLNDNHDYNVYSKQWNDWLLNKDSRVVKFGDEFDWDAKQVEYFIRPCADSKTFTGKLYDWHSWHKFKDDHFAEQERFARLNNGERSSSLDENSLIQVATPKKILKEFRFWAVGGKIATGSLYKMGSSVIRGSLVDDGALDFAQSMVDKFQIASSFVIDVAMVDADTYKIVECGCINSAGFYYANMQKLIMALEDYYN